MDKKQLWVVVLLLLSAWTLSAQTYSIGDIYTAPDGSQGIVYYLYPDGTGGWVVALTDASSGCAWGDNTDVPQMANLSNGYNYGDFYSSDTASYTNTRILRNYQNNNSYASGVVDFAQGWVLPTVRQLRVLYSRQAFISTPLLSAGGVALVENDNYWTCLEHSSEKAKTVDFSSGLVTQSNKSNLCHVRAVRSFSYLPDTPSPEYAVVWSTGDTTETITVTPSQITVYTVNISYGGCAGTAQHTIVVNSPSSYEFSITSETPYTWNGVTYNQSGDYTQTFTNVGGCDSVVTLHLTINSAMEITVNATDDTICEGESVTLQTDVTLPDPAPVLYVPLVAPGDILCTDGSIEKPSSWPVPGKTALGIIVYVNNSDNHGWAIHLHEQGVMPWSTAQSGNIPNAIIHDTPAEAISDYNGSYNTLAIRSVTNTSLYPAAMAVDFDNGWYLPASGQLYLMFPLMPILNESLAVCGGTLFDLNSSWYYCSSSVAVARNMWSLDYSGYIIHYLPGLDYHVRSMRNF